MQGSYGLMDLACTVVEACCRATSITEACRSLGRAPDEGTVRHHFSKLSMASLEAEANRVLATYALKALPRRRLKAAVDLTFIPYHGRWARRSRELRRGRAKHGTGWFHAYASAYVMLQGRRFTLAVKYVRRGGSYAHIVAYLLRRLERLGVRVSRLYLDRQFYRVDVINLLRAKGVAFLIPVICRGRSKRRREAASPGEAELHDHLHDEEPYEGYGGLLPPPRREGLPQTPLR